jgi:5-methylcytosine-specific restriction protein B
MIIDEVNRGNLSKIFGELLFNLEYRNYKNNTILPYSKEKFHVPDNVFIIGTMNSADRSIALVDYALRRRFYFIELLPDEQILRKYLEKNIPKDVSLEEILDLFNEINKIIEKDTLGKHYQLGQSYFMLKDINRDKIGRLWRYAIKPILRNTFWMMFPI